jgi:hypothetical protein
MARLSALISAFGHACPFQAISRWIPLKGILHGLSSLGQFLSQGILSICVNSHVSRCQMAPYQGRETCFKCLKEEKEQAQPQLYGTQYFSVRIALTGHLQYRMADSWYFWVVTRSTSPAILTGVREQEGTEQATSHHTSRPPDARMKRTCGS